MIGANINKSARALAAVVCVALLALAGCADDSIVQIGGRQGSSIDRGTLNHWMQALAGGDFRESVGTEGPTGLASEPADPGRCFAATKLVGPRSFFNQLRLTRVQVERTCRELHSAIKDQALSYLVASRWIIAEGARRGVAVSEANFREALAGFRSRLEPTEQSLHRSLVERHWSLADLLYRLKVEVLAAKVAPQATTALTDLAEGKSVPMMVHVPRYHDLLKRTICSAGYVVPGCMAYRDAPAGSQAPDVVLTQLVGRRRDR